MGESTTKHDGHAADASDGTERWLQRTMLLTALLAGSVAMAKEMADADLWGHVTFGMNVLADRTLPTTASHTFTAEGYRWINHENLSELTLAALTWLGGGTALLVFKCLLGMAILGAVIWTARHQSVGVVATCTVVLLVAVNLTASWTLRPQLLSYGWFTLMIVLLNAAFAKFRPTGEINVGYLWAILGVMFLWANSHGGFVAGYALFSLYLICRSIAALLIFGKPAWKGVCRLALITFCVGLVTLVNPYGPHLHLWLVESLGRPRPEITEWIPLSIGYTAFWPIVAIMALSILALLVSDRHRDWAQIVLLSVTAWQTVLHVRHAPFFAILVGLWLPVHVDALLTKIGRLRKRPKPEGTTNGSKLVLAGMVAACVLLAAVIFSRTQTVQVDKTEFPVDAVHFMADNGLDGKLVVTYNWAQYAIAALGPDTRVAFDGRFRTCYPQQIVDMHFDLILGNDPQLRWRGPDSKPFNAFRVLKFGQPDLVLLDRSQHPSVMTMTATSDWALLYQDGIAQVWGRRSRFDEPSSPYYLPPSRRRFGDAPPSGFAQWPALPAALRPPAASANFVQGFPRSDEI